MEILYCEIVGNDFFLDIVSWIVVDCAVEHKNNLQLFIRRNGAHGNRVRPNCAGFYFEKNIEKKNIIPGTTAEKGHFSYVLLFAGLTINFLFQMCTIGGDTFQVCY